MTIRDATRSRPPAARGALARLLAARSGAAARRGRPRAVESPRSRARRRNVALLADEDGFALAYLKQPDAASSANLYVRPEARA